MKSRVLDARAEQEKRLRNYAKQISKQPISYSLTNGSMSAKEFQNTIIISKEINSFLADYVEKGVLTGR